MKSELLHNSSAADSKINLKVFLCVAYLHKLSKIFQLDERGSPYLDASGQIVIRFDLVTLQTLPIGMKSVPRFDFQLKHLLRARYGVHFVKGKK